MTYYFTYFGLLLAAYLGRGGVQVREALYWTLLIALFIFSGFRFEVGCDWSGYFYHYLTPIDNISGALLRREAGHWSIIYALQEFGLPYQFLNVVTSGLFFLGLHAFAKRQPNPLSFLVLAFPILIINMPMTALRQGAAIGLMCLAFCAFIDKRLIYYVFWILIGSAFHSSILAFLVFTPFILGQLSVKNATIATILAIPGALGLMQSEAAEVAQQRYLLREIDSYGAAFRLGILSISGLLFIWQLAPAWRRDFPDDYKLAAFGAWLMVAFFSLFFVSTVIGDRFGYYLIPVQLMIFARIPYLTTLRNKQLWSVAPYAGLTLVFVVWTQLSWHFNQCYIPYNIRFGAPVGLG